MSSSLQWSPVRQDGKSLSYELKLALRKRHGGSVDVRMSESSVPYLQGLADAGIEDAQTLMDAINKHGEIDVKEIY